MIHVNKTQSKPSKSVSVTRLSFMLVLVTLHLIAAADGRGRGIIDNIGRNHRHHGRGLFSFWKTTTNHNVINFFHLFNTLLTLPPSVRLAMNQELELKKDCQVESSTSKNEFIWMPQISDCNYLFAYTMFQQLYESQKGYKQSRTVWFPSIEKEETIKSFVNVLNSKNSNQLLDGLQVKLSSWPKSPATNIQIKWKMDDTDATNNANNNKDNDEIEATSAAAAAATATTPATMIRKEQVESSIKETEQWVEEKLCGLGLCPYTISMHRAAVGLDNVGVREGPIAIRHSNDEEYLFSMDSSASTSTSSTNRNGRNRNISLIPSSITLLVAFWNGVVELATKSEMDVSTLLIIGNEDYYDDNFKEFSTLFDTIIEPCVQLTGTDNIVGRALFHPQYDSSMVFDTNDSSGKNNKVLPGHALPASMVEGFMKKYSQELATMTTTAATTKTDGEAEAGGETDTGNGTTQKYQYTIPDIKTIAKANDAVRWTPHATINLLRRSQLSASKRAEAANPFKKPNFIYAKNVQRILSNDPNIP